MTNNNQQGHHPIDVNQFLDSHKMIYAKLGFGETSTTWLCSNRDYDTWEAVKVLSGDYYYGNELYPDMRLAGVLKEKDMGFRAEHMGFGAEHMGFGAEDKYFEKHHICLPSDQFGFKGPNGSHTCLVLPILGPRLRFDTTRPILTLKKHLYHVAEGLRFLHGHKICHRDLRESNVYLKPPDIYYDSDRVATYLKDFRPEISSIEEPTANTPKYWVPPQTFPAKAKDQIVITNFKYWMVENDPHDDWEGPAAAYKAPEALLQERMNHSTDVWAFAHMILSVRAGRYVFKGLTAAEVAWRMEAVLGPCPEQYGSSAGQLFVNKSKVERERERLQKKYGYEDPLEGLVRGNPRIEVSPSTEGTPTDTNAEPTTQSHIPNDEASVLLDLLRKCFKYEESERLTLDGMMQHEWFNEVR